MGRCQISGLSGRKLLVPATLSKIFGRGKTSMDYEAGQGIRESRERTLIEIITALNSPSHFTQRRMHDRRLRASLYECQSVAWFHLVFVSLPEEPRG